MKNIVKVNRQQSPEELKQIIAKLTAEITRLNTYIKSLEIELTNLKGDIQVENSSWKVELKNQVEDVQFYESNSAEILRMKLIWK